MDNKKLNLLYNIAAVIIAVLVLGFAWFYMREQFCFAFYPIILLLVFIEYLKLKNWFKDTVSVQVIIHKNEKDDDKNM